jgi:hypothetical protein
MNDCYRRSAADFAWPAGMGEFAHIPAIHWRDQTGWIWRRAWACFRFL